LGALLASAPACGAIHPGLATHALVSGGGFASLGASGALQVATAKLAAIALAVAAGLPGGVIFPLFFAGAALAQSLTTALLPSSRLLPLATVCTMAGLQAATTRTPLSSVLMLVGSAAAFIDVAAALPFAATSAYAAAWTAQWMGLSFFDYPVVKEKSESDLGVETAKSGPFE
jgi:H+/Cl- antiporter ClcA